VVTFKDNFLFTPYGMVVTDLDGTLLNNSGSIGEKDIKTLKLLEEKRILRIIATGRSLFSAEKVLKDDLPVDFLIFSSGAGILEYKTKRLVNSIYMNPEQSRFTARVLIGQEVDFMVHMEIPDNHYFLYFRTGKKNPDFERRLELYSEFGRPANSGELINLKSNICQFVVILKPGDKKHERLNELLKPLRVIRTTSPIDGKSVWIEVFPPEVSKASAVQNICISLGVDKNKVLAVGNDFNDLDILMWAGWKFIVANATEDLKKHFPCVKSNENSGFSHAVNIWLKKMNL